MRSTRLLLVVLGAAATIAACRQGSTMGSADAPPDGGYADLEQMYGDMAKNQPGQADRWSCYGRQMGYAQRMGGLVVPWGGMGRGPMRRGPMMHRMGMRGSGWGVMADWHREMAALHRRLAGEARQAGNDQAAARHDAIAQEHLRIAEDLGQTSAPPSFRDESGAKPAALFAHACAPCHQQNGEGVAGTFPPLKDNPVVSGDQERLIRIVLHGLVGPLRVGPGTYYGVMPAFAAQLSDEQVASVLTYVRTAWRAPAAAITGEQVAAVRTKEAGRSTPWTTAELGLEPEKP